MMVKEQGYQNVVGKKVRCWGGQVFTEVFCVLPFLGSKTHMYKYLNHVGILVNMDLFFLFPMEGHEMKSTSNNCHILTGEECVRNVTTALWPPLRDKVTWARTWASGHQANSWSVWSRSCPTGPQTAPAIIMGSTGWHSAKEWLTVGNGNSASSETSDSGGGEEVVENVLQESLSLCV